MDLHTLISAGLHEKLICCLCKNYLSYFPILIGPNNQNVCGRCTIPAEPVFYHEQALETLCNCLRFPCRYQTQGCSEELSPEEVPQHEKNCSFRVVTCIMSKPCDWSGSLPTLTSHLHSEHSEAFLQDGTFKLDLSCSKECEFLLDCDKNVIIGTRKFDLESNLLHFTINAPYHNLGSDDWQICITGTNTALLHDLTIDGSEKKICTKLRLHSVMDENDKRPLLCKIHNTSCSVPNDVPGDVSDVFTCGVCRNVATPPIYRCPYDMSVKCSPCKMLCHPSIKCPNSEKDDKMSRLVKLVNHPCKYKKNGCNRIALFDEMKIHEAVCCYRSEKCPLHTDEKCVWEGLVGDVNGHVVSEHSQSVFKGNCEFTISSKDTYTNPTSKYILFCDHLFKLTYLVRDNCYAWTVQTIFSEAECFKYEIDIGNDEKGRRLRISKNCGQIKQEHQFRDLTTCCFVLGNQVTPLVENNDDGRVLSFKIRIFK